MRNYGVSDGIAIGLISAGVFFATLLLGMALMKDKMATQCLEFGKFSYNGDIYICEIQTTP